MKSTGIFTPPTLMSRRGITRPFSPSRLATHIQWPSTSAQIWRPFKPPIHWQLYALFPKCRLPSSHGAVSSCVLPLPPLVRRLLTLSSLILLLKFPTKLLTQGDMILPQARQYLGHIHSRSPELLLSLSPLVVQILTESTVPLLSSKWGARGDWGVSVVLVAWGVRVIVVPPPTPQVFCHTPPTTTRFKPTTSLD